MFGHQNDDLQQAQPGVPGDSQAPITPDPSVTPSTTDSSYVAMPSASPADPSSPLLEPEASDGYVNTPTTTQDAALTPSPTPIDTPTLPQPPESTPTPPADANNLLDIKQQVLQQLSPLVGHLDQSPEEKFRTTMMMIQASDNQDLIQTAYDIAGQISDEKARAQALLDIVNEINYFTQHNTAE